MQTILSLQSESAGVIYLNGRMAGEIDGEHTLSLPVSPTGVLLLQMHPFERDLLPLSLRLTLSRGVPILPDVPDERFCAALWYGGVLEIELMPQRLPVIGQETFLFEQSGIRFFWLDSPETLLCETSSGSFTHPMPRGAQPPALTPLSEGLLLTGQTNGESEEYALVLSSDGREAQLSLTGRSISLPDGKNALRLLRPLGDSLGRAQLETWQRTAQGWTLSQSEPMWLDGTPHHPQTPDQTAIAALEAAQLGLMNEAQSYFAPMCSGAEVLERASLYDGCVPLRYPLPGGESAVGLMKMEGSLLRITPVIYRASRISGRGAWQLEQLQLVENS